MPLLPGGGGGLGGIGGWAAGPIMFGADILVAILGSLFGFGGGVSAQDLNAAIGQLREQMSKAVDILKRFSWTTAFALGALLQAFHDFWVGFMDQLLSLVKKIAHALARLFTEILPRLLEWMQKMQKRLDELYAKYVRPILDWIQFVRRYLAILRIFHIAWAQKLDDELVRIEGKIIGPYLLVRRWLGSVGQWMNILVTVRGTIQRAVFINTLFAHGADWVNMWWVMQSGQLNGRATPAVPGPEQPQSFAQVQAELMQYAQTGTGPYSDDVSNAISSALSVS